MQSVLLSSPALEPVTLAEAKTYLKVTHSFEDGLIQTLVSSARKTCEDAARIAISPQKWSIVFRAPHYSGDEWGLSRTLYDPEHIGQKIVLPRPPVVSVDAVAYMNLAGELVPSEEHSVNLNLGSIFWRDHSRLYSWEFPYLQVDYTVGYPATSTEEGQEPDPAVPAVKAPEDIREAILSTVASLYAKRGDDAAVLPARAMQLLRPYWNTPRYAG